MSITEVEDLTMFCRVCLQLPLESELLDLNLIYDEDEQLTYYDCFTVCTQIQISDGEGLPQNLCRSCGLELQMAYDFYKKVDESKRFLIQLQDQQAKALLPATEEEVNDATPLVFEQEEVVEQEQEQEQEMEEEVEVEEHLDMEEYQAVEHLDDEENVRLIFIEKATGLAQPVLQILTPLNHPMNTVVKVATRKTTTYNNGAKHEQQFLAEICKQEKTDENEQHNKTQAAHEQPDDIPTTFTPSIEANKLAAKHSQTKRLRFTHNGHISTAIVCDVCNKEFPNRSRMLWHRRIHDQNRIKYPCPAADCKRVYATKQASYVHYKQSHLVEGLACPVCNKLFIVRQSLEVHMRYHTGEFPYACELCGKRFGQKSHLTTHMQVKHHNLRYYCQEPNCNKIFKNSMSLRNHRFVHTEMPFKCEYCEKGFPQKSKLKAHIIGKHNIDVTFEQLESMKKFEETRTRYSFVKLLKTEKQGETDVSKKDCLKIEK